MSKKSYIATVGMKLYRLRKQRGLTMRDIEQQTGAIASRFADTAYAIRRSQLSLYERGKALPSLPKLYSLKMVYGCSYPTLMRAFGVGMARRIR